MTDIEFLTQDLTASSRSTRQKAAAALCEQAKENPEEVASYINLFVESLDRPEARTRWECLDILSLLVPINSEACEQALLGAEAALFDEESGQLHLAAIRFLCALGGSSKQLSVKVWSLLDEGIQCYHGDIEFEEMLNALVVFSQGDLDDGVKELFKARMSFDANNPKGITGRRAKTIIANLEK